MIKKNPYRRFASKDTSVTKTTDSKIEKNSNLYDEDGKYNPRPLGGFKGTGKAVSASKGRMFDKKGEVNAWSTKDLAQQIAHLMQNVTKDGSAPKEALRKESSLSKEAKKRAIVAAFKDPSGEGFHLIGQELLAPIKEVIDYEGWTRKCLRIRPLAQGELFRLTKDVAYNTIAWVIGQDGQTPESRVYGKYVIGPEFKITAFVDIDIAEIYQMQFDGLDRAQDLARQDIERKEDQAFISALDKAATTFNSLTIIGASLTISNFEDIRFQVERNRLVVDKFLINRAELSDIVKLTSAGSSGTIDMATQRELILSGYIGNILNCQIVTSAGTQTFEVVPAGKVYAVTAPEYLGDMGIRIDLFSEPYNKYAVNQTVKGWALIEQVGFILPNSRAIAKGSK